jgi:hypothetical protein
MKQKEKENVIAVAEKRKAIGEEIAKEVEENKQNDDAGKEEKIEEELRKSVDSDSGPEGLIIPILLLVRSFGVPIEYEMRVRKSEVSSIL